MQSAEMLYDGQVASRHMTYKIMLEKMPIRFRYKIRSGSEIPDFNIFEEGLIISK